MSFDVATWQEKAGQTFRQAGRWLKNRRDKELPYIAYGAVSTMAIWPVVEAAVQTGQFYPALGALYTLAGGVGANLLAEQLGRWKERADSLTEAEVEAWISQQVVEDAALRQALDTILTELKAIPQVQAALPAEERAWFVRTLRHELAGLGNAAHFEALQLGPGGLAQGPGAVAAGQEGMAVGGSVGGDILMPGARKEVHPPPQTEAEAAESRLARLKQRYLEALVHHCNLLPLAALGQDEETGDAVRLDEVYVDLDTTSRVPLTEAEKKEEKYRYRSQEDRPLAALEAAAQATRLVILGDPGSGKSTFVRQIASKVAAGRLGGALPAGWPLSGWPMLTTLRDLAGRLAALDLAGLAEGAQERRLVEAVEAQWRADIANLHAGQLGEHLAELLLDEPLLLIFDGLDEVPEGVRPRVRRAVQAVLRAYPKVARVIVTCRVRSYSGGAVLPDFAGHTLATLSSDN